MKRKYDGFFLKQRDDANSPMCFAFYAAAKEVLEWASIKRISESPDGIQRILRESRVKAISRFFSSSPINVIPNNVLVAFNNGDVTRNQELPSSQCDKAFSGSIEFEDDIATISLVDGQHRLFGMAAYEGESLPILVVALLDVDNLEQAFQFVVVNNKAVKVPTTDVKSIIAENLDESALIERLMGAGVNYGKHSPMLKEINELDASPFKGLLDWEFNRDGTKMVSVTAIEQTIKYLKDTFKQLQDDNDSLFEIYCSIWGAVKEAYPNAWANEESYLMKKVSLNAFNQSLVDRLALAYEMSFVDIFAADKVKSQVASIVSQLPEEFWTKPWSIKVQDNANIRDIIMDDIRQVLQNKKQSGSLWFSDLTLIKNTHE